MTKNRSKPPSSGKAGKDGDDGKKKTDTDSNKKGKGKEKNSPSSPKSKSRSDSARKRWGIPVKAWDATLAKLQIQLNIGDKAETPEPIITETTKKKTYCIKKYEKVIKRSEMAYVVRRGALNDADIVVWMPEKLDGLRFANGLPVSHSILGSIADYLAADNEHKRDEESKTDRFDNSSALPETQSRTRAAGTLDLEYLTSYKLDQGKALEAWEAENIQRQILGDTIARKSKRPTGDLLMGNHPYRVANGQPQEYHDFESAWKSEIRATQPNGFWKQEERLGDDLRGIHFALTKTERGIAADPEVVYRPGSGRLNQNDAILDLTVKNGMSSRVSDNTLNIEHPSPLISPLPEIIEIDSVEPIIAIGDQILTWSTRDSVVDLELGILTAPGETKRGRLTIVNIGSCVIRFELFKIPKAEDPEIMISRRARDKMGLFLDDSPGIILPGDYKNVSAIFHCHRAAIFSEQWRLVTAPILAREITLTVWGIAKDLRQLGQDGDEIDRVIEDKCQSSFVQNILDGVIDRMFWEPPPKRTEGFPEHVDPKWFKSITGRDLFASTNPGHFYRSETVAKIIEIAELSLPENKFDKWSLPVSTIRQSLLYMQEEVKLQKQVVLKNEIANAFMTYVGDLTHGVDFPVTNRKYAMCKLLLLKVCNNICDIASRIKKAHGITLDMDFEIEFSKDDPRSQTDGRPNTPAKNRTKTPPKSPSRDSKTKKKHTSRDSSTPSSPTSPKSSRFGKLVKGISAAMKSQYKHRARPIMYMKYLEKLHISAYIIVKNYIYTISGFLADLPEVETLRL